MYKRQVLDASRSVTVAGSLLGKGKEDFLAKTKSEYQTFNGGSANTAIPIFFVESMRDVALGMIGATKLRILPATRDTRLNNVRVMDAGNHTVTPGGELGGEDPITVRILLVVDYVQLRDRGRFLSNNYEITA